MRPAPTRAVTGAVVVTHEPDEQVASRLRAIAALADRTLVVDNLSRSPGRVCLESLAGDATVTVLWNEVNLGVATALNQGCAWAIDRGYDWVLLFDQDSRPDPDLLEQMAGIFAEYPDRDRVAVVGANHRDPRSLLTARGGRGRSDASWLEVKTVITSGSLLSLEAFRAIGPFRDDFFIDEVDHEFCLRARSRGFSVLRTRAPLLEHGPGHVTRERLAGRVVHPTHHSPPRWYYMSRNHVVMAREYLYKEPGWVFSSFVHRLKSTVKMLLFEDSRRVKLAYAWRGLRDGLGNRLGPMRGRG